MERVVQQLSEAQASLHHEVHVVTSTNGALNSPNEQTLNNVNIHRIPSLRFFYPDLTIPRNLPIDLLKKADIVHIHAHHCLFSLKILTNAFDLKAKNICTFMGIDAFEHHPNFIIRHFGPYYRKRNTLKALKKTNSVLVKSFRDMELLRNNYATASNYLPDGIPEIILSSNKSDSSEFRRKYGITQENLFLFIGRMHKLKGPQILINALKYVGTDTAAVLSVPMMDT